MKTAVVGGGIHGASTALALADRGHEVTLFEQFPLLHERGSSHGESRIVRKAYPDAFYTSLMAEAYPLWHDLEARTGEKLLHEVGLAYFGNRHSANLEGVVKGLNEVQEPFEIFEQKSVASIFPALQLNSDEIALFTPAAGWVEASKCTRITLDLVKSRGAHLIESHRPDFEVLQTNFDAFVVAPGAWINDWVPALPVNVTLQTVAFFKVQIDGPVWIEESNAFAYGFPSLGSLGSKIAYHGLGRPIGPNDGDRAPDGNLVRDLGDVLTRRFKIENPRLERSYGCLYTNTPDEDFRIGRLRENGFFVSACSGHGFKFGPWVGRLMADLVEGKRQTEAYPRFASLDR